MVEELVTIAKYHKPFEAQLAKNYLEARGFEPTLSNELAVATWAAGMAVGDVQLQVPAHQAGEALEAMRQCESLVVAGAAEAPAAEPGARPDLEEEASEISYGDALASRAWRAAILGSFVLPPLLNVYSLSVLLQLFGWEGELSPTATRKMRAALIIDCVVLALALVLLEAWLALW